MSMITAILKVLGCQAAGEVIVAGLDLPIPGAIVGMAILFGYLSWRGIQAELGKLFDRVIPHLPLFFIPAGVGFVAEIEVIRQSSLVVAVAVLAGTVVTIASSAILAERFMGAHVDAGEQEGAIK